MTDLIEFGFCVDYKHFALFNFQSLRFNVEIFKAKVGNLEKQARVAELIAARNAKIIWQITEMLQK